MIREARVSLGSTRMLFPYLSRVAERDFFTDNLLVRVHFIIEMIWWIGLAPWEFEFPFRVGEDRVLDGPASGEKSFKGGPYTYCNPRT